MSTPAATNTVLTLGVQGPPGVGALNTTLSSSFTIPALSNTTVTNVVSASGVFVGAWVTVQGAGTFYVNGVAGNQLVLLNAPLAYPSNSAAGTVIASGATVISSGPPGPQGPTGSNGTNGTNGASAYTTTVGSVTQPAVSSSVSVSVASGAGFAVGQVVYMGGGGGYYTVASAGALTLSLTNLGYPGNGAPGNPVGASGSSVTAGGLQGPAGSGGFTAGGDLSGSTTSQQVQSLTGASGTGIVPFPAAATGPGFSQASTTGATGANMTITPQASTNANGTPGNFVVSLANPTGTGNYPYQAINQGGSPVAAFGAIYPGVPNAVGLSLGLGSVVGTTPSSANYTLYTNAGTGNTVLNGYGGTLLQASSTTFIRFGSSANNMSFPIVGDTNAFSPYGVHGDVTTAITTTSALTAAQYSQGLIRVTPTGAMTLSGFPLAASAAGYPKEILVGAAFAVTVSDGTHTKTLPAISGLYRLWFTSTGIYGGVTAL